MGLLNDISNYIREGETENQNLGLEIEHFVVDDHGNQIGFHEITELISQVGQSLGADIVMTDGYPAGYSTATYAVSLEPACQFEISIYPYSNLDKIRDIYDDFINLWKPILNSRGYHLETKGNLPSVEHGLVTPDSIPVSPKKRYQYMDQYFQTSGKYGRYMMRASASSQVSIDYRSEEDMVRKLRVLEKIAPLLMILMENKSDPSSTLPGAHGKPHLLRIQEWDDLDPDRTGFIPDSLNQDFGYDKMAEVIYETPLILLADEGETSYVAGQSAADLVKHQLLDESNLDEDRKKRLIEHFMSMGFFHFRVKKYIEVRIADSVPVETALGYVALIKGLVYSQENLDYLDGELKPVDSLHLIQEAVETIERDGNDARIYGKPVPDWINMLMTLAGRALDDRDKEYLENVHAFWSDSR